MEGLVFKPGRRDRAERALERDAVMRRIAWLAFLALIPVAGAFGQGKLKNPAALKEKAPASFQAKFVTSKGDIVLEAKRAWSPHGVDRFYNLIKNGFFDGVRFFRVV